MWVHKVYQGGIGSYALLVMVAGFLLLHPSRGGPGGRVDLEANLGVLLMDFLRLYGRALNTIDVGVSCRQGPSLRSVLSIVMYILVGRRPCCAVQLGLQHGNWLRMCAERAVAILQSAVGACCSRSGPTCWPWRTLKTPLMTSARAATTYRR